jgi:hypothetical protein
MALTREKSKARGDKVSFAGIPRHVMDHPDYKRLSGGAVKLLLEFARQYKGKNNGDLTAAYAVLKDRGFSSKATIARCIKELLESGLVIQTRTGKFINPGGVCALYALAWNAIDECPGKRLEVKPTRTPPRKFSLESKNPCPVSGPSIDPVSGATKQRDESGKFVSTQFLDRLEVST